MKKECIVLSVVLLFVGLIAKCDVVVITKSQLPALFRSPANFDMQSEQWLYNATDNILLFGGESRGTLYAAYHFLEDVNGVHWWTPWGEESVPSSMATISDNSTLAGIPAFSYRENYSALTDSVERPFYAKNRCNGETTYLGINYGWHETWGQPAIVHTFGLYVPASQYFASHPEYFALFNNTRNQAQLCMSNNDVYDIILTKLTTYIAQDKAAALAGGYPPPRYYDLSQNDNSLVYCQCSTCAALIQAQGNAISAPVVTLVNRLAAAIKSTYPDVILTTLAYQLTEKPPSSLQVEENVAIRVAGINNNFAKPFLDSANASFNNNLQGWSNLTKHLFIWHYQTTFGSNAAHNFVTTNLENDLRYCRDHKVENIFIEHENYKFPEVSWECDNWVTLKLMENPDLSISALRDTFCSGYYGTTAGTAIRQYMSQISSANASNNDFHTWNSTIANYSYINCDFVAAAQQHWAAAEAGATGIQLQRVKNARLGFDRYVLHSGQRLIDEYAAAHGGSVANFSTDVINLYQAAQRSLVTLNNLPADRFPTSRFTAALKNSEIADMNMFSTNFQAVIASAALPSQIANSTHTVYYPMEFTLFPGSNDCSIVVDPILPTRMSILTNWPSNYGGIYHRNTKITNYFNPIPTINDAQYQWYQLGGTMSISSSDYMFFLPTWHLQIYYGSKVCATGRTSATFWGEFRRLSPTQVYLNRIAVVSN